MKNKRLHKLTLELSIFREDHLLICYKDSELKGPTSTLPSGLQKLWDHAWQPSFKIQTFYWQFDKVDLLQLAGSWVKLHVWPINMKLQRRSKDWGMDKKVDVSHLTYIVSACESFIDFVFLFYFISSQIPCVSRAKIKHMTQWDD